ncbi:uncharacterized protein MELLADRAFT_94485 [Melampsora larici-populina 98AG31]|uniref:Uncharacterized protein n=1 Tax=Melampsora larici-populina (strain 98AG31 / pathotype 3-4-7) TaxID=747676 RepID=F4RBL1_MELLP|nr:uncharacterized protein MELLADRAFT_94485 [Melampsora larici-populina 98AG31]EGG10316.1 hypothetical protein MELLADRAFT_94485 [Melampsora larici-populina 98AG31]
MANPTNQNSNTEKFNEMMRRSSDRLRGGSVPPPDSEPVVISPATTNQCGRGRGRGRRNGVSSGRNATQVSNDGVVTPVVTLTVPGGNEPPPPPLPAPSAQDASSNSQNSAQPASEVVVDPQVNTGTSVLYSAGIIARDNVVITQPLRSPTRRNTITAVRESPPRGLNSWLLANGLIVVNNPIGSSPARQGVTSAVPKEPASGNPNQRSSTAITAASVLPASNPAASVTVPAKKKVVDLTKEADEVNKDSAELTTKKKAEVGKAGIQTHGLVALSKYWDDKMRPMDGYVPLSIFNPVWLRQDLLRIKPKNAKDKDETRYTGLNVPEEWKMTFGEWVTAFDLFVAYLWYYDHGKLADKFLIHKANVLAIKAETTVMTIRNKDGRLANPAICDKTFEQNARMDSERLNGFQPRFGDINPYADFECKSNINPISGELITHSVVQNGTIANSHLSHPNHLGKPNARSWACANQHSNHSPYQNQHVPYASQPVYDGPGSSGYHHYEDRRGGGRNVRGRGRGGLYNGGSNREERYDARGAESGGSWRKDGGREDHRGGDRDVVGPKYGGGGKAKRTCYVGFEQKVLPG